MHSRFISTKTTLIRLALLWEILCLVLTVPITARLIGYHGPRLHGSYKVGRRGYFLPEVLDPSNPRALVIYPRKILKEGNTEKFPLVVFAHGATGGGWKLYADYIGLLNGVASFGFIVVAPRSCDVGCPRGEWNTYYQQQLKLIEWTGTQRNDSILQFIDHEAKHGLFGHSRGGQATVDALEFAVEYNISAAVILHPAPLSKAVGNITVPLAAFTGTRDGCCGEAIARPIYEAASTPKAYANMVNARHTEPNLFFPRWTAYTAAWFKIHLNNDTSYFHDLIYGSDPKSLCGGGIPMTENCAAIPQT